MKESLDNCDCVDTQKWSINVNIVEHFFKHFIRDKIKNQKLFSIRIIKAHKGSLVKYIEQWNKAVHKAPTEIINKLSDAVQVFFSKDESRFEQQWYPFWIAAKSGDAQLCQHIIEKCNKLSQGDLGDVLKMVVVEVCNDAK